MKLAYLKDGEEQVLFIGDECDYPRYVIDHPLPDDKKGLNDFSRQRKNVKYTGLLSGSKPVPNTIAKISYYLYAPKYIDTGCVD